MDSDNSLENSIHIDEAFVLIHNDKEEEIEKHLESLNEHIVELEKRNKKLENDYGKLEKRHGELLKLMNEILKIKPSNHIDGLDTIKCQQTFGTAEPELGSTPKGVALNGNLEEIRKRITQILYNEVRRQTVFSFTPILGSYTINCQSLDTPFGRCLKTFGNAEPELAANPKGLALHGNYFPVIKSNSIQHICNNLNVD